jgi:STIMATE family
MMHFINVFLAVIMGKHTSSDPCGFYFITVVIDVTFGTLISILLLYGFNRLVTYQCSKKLKSGNYFQKEKDEQGRLTAKIDYWCYAQQTLCWIMIVLVVIKLSPDENNSHRDPVDFQWQSHQPRRFCYGDVVQHIIHKIQQL